MTPTRERAWIAVIPAAAIAIAVLVSVRPHVTGLFHDDGLYTVTARSLAAGTGYHIVSLPGAPPETKYPILYSYVLSWVWWINPRFPSNVLMLKAVNVACLFAIMVAAYGFFRRTFGGSRLSALAYVALIGTNSMLVSFTDFILSDTLFVAFAMGAFLLHAPPYEDLAARRWRSGCAAIVVSLAYLTREVGASLIVAGMLVALLTRQRRTVAIYGAIVAASTAAWLVWRTGAQTPLNPLLTYYTRYEKPAWLMASSDLPRAARIVWDNVQYLLKSFDLGFLFHAIPAVRWLIYPIVVLGAVVLARRRDVFLMTFVVAYTAIVLNHPFVPGRYVIPLLPIALACLFAGIFEVEARVIARAGPDIDRGLVRAFVHAPVALLVLLNLMWFVTYMRHAGDDPIRGWYGQRFSYGWSGFTETFDWINSHTHETDVLATSYDPMYYLYTGRRGVRPWFHHPETYFYPIQHPVPYLGEPDEIRRALDELRARYLIVDPLEGYGEAPAAPQLFERLLAAYPSRPPLVFVSHDSLHKVYELPSSER